MTKKRLTINELELMTQTKYIGTSEVRGIIDDVLGDDKKHNIVFDIFDGFAYCPNYRGNELTMRFPKLSLIKEANGMQKNIRESLNLQEDTEITVLHILAVYFQLEKNSI